MFYNDYGHYLVYGDFMKEEHLLNGIKDFSYEDIEKIPIFRIISTLHRTHLVYINRHLEEYNISFGQFPYLMVLYVEGSLTQDYLVKFFNVTDGVVTRALNKLESDGLILREQDPDNKRRNIIYLTSSGEKLAKKVENLEDAWENEVFSLLDKDDFDKMKYNLHLASIIALDINSK